MALLVGFALQALGAAGEPVLRGVGHIQRVVFKILAMIMWVAPIGAFGAIADVVGPTGMSAQAVRSDSHAGLLHDLPDVRLRGARRAVLQGSTAPRIFTLVKYLGREYLLIFATSSSETGLPRLMAKMEHVGVQRPAAGIVVPTGYSFNLDGTAIYLTMASLFIADALSTRCRSASRSTCCCS